MSLAILGLGTAVPDHRFEQHESVAMAKVLASATDEQGEMLTSLYRHTGIVARHLVLERDVFEGMVDGTDEMHYLPKNTSDLWPDTERRMKLYTNNALPLALRATRQALDEADMGANRITHLVTVSCTGFSAPGFDIGLIKGLGLPATVRRTHIGFMGCHGGFNGMAVARAFADSDPSARILVCSTEICSIHFHYTWNPLRAVGNSLFADGCGALVGAPSRNAPWRADANGSCLFADSEFAMSWKIGNHGFDMTLSTKVPSLIADNIRPWIDEWLASHGLTIGDIGSWAIHPGGPRILSTVEEALGLIPDTTWASREVLTQFGNMSSATVFFILDRLRRHDAPLPCVALGFGPGLVAEAALFR